MGFCMINRDGRYRPEIFCDHCNEPIEDWKLANVTSPVLPLGGDKHLPIRVLHKECDLVLRNEGRADQGSEDLHQYLVWLLWNKTWGSPQHGEDTDQIVVKVPKTIEEMS